MAISPWQKRIERAHELSLQHPFAEEILGFYIHVARFQEEVQEQCKDVSSSSDATFDRDLAELELAELGSRFEACLSLAEKHGPQPLAQLSRDLRTRGSGFRTELLNVAWTAQGASDAQGILARIVLQPYAVLLRMRAAPRHSLHATAVCPFCYRKPGVGVLRQQGDGAARSLICSFCMNEWEFRRIVCPACGEEDDKKLPVFTVADFECIRVECCESCKTFIKTVDLAKDGRAEPVVDELVSAPLDLWARERGYAKLQPNIFGM